MKSNILNKTHRRKKGSKPLRTYRSTASAEYQRALENKFGKLGPASSVRMIDSATGEVLAIIQPH